ncbi:MAG TPA: DUF362 domain-containing protein [candidate division WOR-3 bacterium]|uniref:DUF362 domain-containing protein n=1 Tax=candidate division WOR-3 bacterium TaxID=2052148 RepID=A0A9C9EKR2_UNCW3|nr:DUF362 domain-containing protein [candidate division WOR-3 bacterium]
MKNISRREFLKYLGVGTIGIMAKPKIPFAKEKEGNRASDVIQCFDENATSAGSVNETVVQIMMDESIKRLTGINSVGDAWKSIFPGITESSIISIKVNTINSAVPTNPEVINCIINGLAQMQFGANYFPKNNVIIWDRSDGELTSCGYTIYTGNDPDTPRCFGTDHSGVGYDSGCPLDVPGGPVYPSRIMSLLSDYLINVGVLKNHSTAQVTLSLKNHYGSVSPVPSHSNYCDPAIPALNQQIRDVITPNNMQKIFIIDSLWGNVLSGPGGSVNCNPKKIIMSLDTVACDYHSWNVINEERQNLGYNIIPWPIHHIDTATQSPYNLGTTDINLIEINNPSGIKSFQTNRPADGLLKVAPNPFRSNTTIILSLAQTSFVHLDLISASGRVESSIFHGKLIKGTHRIAVNLKNRLPAGSYFIRYYNGGETRIKKVTLID